MSRAGGGRRAAGELERLRAEVRRLTLENGALRELALLDELTGLGNRRQLDGALARELARSRRYGRPLSVGLLDVDHFKRVNDERGHAAGDEVLRGLARLLESSLRTSDLAARFGGEEFALVLPETGAEAAAQVAERVRCAVAASPIAGVPVTVSIGVATAEPGRAADVSELMGAADRAMYAAKAAGRNRVVAA